MSGCYEEKKICRLAIYSGLAFSNDLTHIIIIIMNFKSVQSNKSQTMFQLSPCGCTQSDASQIDIINPMCVFRVQCRDRSFFNYVC